MAALIERAACATAYAGGREAGAQPAVGAVCSASGALCSPCAQSWGVGRQRGRVSFLPVAGVEYRYELRRGDEVVATGHLTRERTLEIGERLEIGGQPGIVRSIEPRLGQRELDLVVQLLRDDS
jgi:hypothetical protein